MLRESDPYKSCLFIALWKHLKIHNNNIIRENSCACAAVNSKAAVFRFDSS